MDPPRRTDGGESKLTENYVINIKTKILWL